MKTRLRPIKIFSLARKYGAVLVALTIDEKGMAKSSDDKVAIAKRLYDLAEKFGLDEGDLLFDVLTFTLASGDEELKSSGIETLNAISE